MSWLVSVIYRSGSVFTVKAVACVSLTVQLVMDVFLSCHHTCFRRNLRLSSIFYTVNSCIDICINISFSDMVKQFVGCIAMPD